MANSVGVGFPSTNLQKGHTFHDLDEGSTWVFLGGPPRLASSWRLLNGIFPNDPDTSLWGTNQAGATWYNLSLQAMRIWDGTQAATMKIAGVPVNLYDYKTAVSAQDDFISGTTASGSVGDLGWSFDVGSGGSIVLPDSERNNQGIIRIRSGTTISNTTGLRLIGTTNLYSEASFDILFLIRPIAIDADTTIRVGVSTNPATVPPTSGIYFEKLPADTNWFCIARTGGVETRVDSNVVITTSFIAVRIVRSQTDVKYYINDVLVATITTNIPSVATTPTINITTAAAADKNIDVDYFQLEISVTR